ncbi:MAG: FlhC family transcriptional regulator, partial [Pseudomonadales bacterium]|nr:FlhC family transcriptional regulator [Pseudomonadales bacterium]
LRTMPPARGMAPFAAGWFLSWQRNIHASLFYSCYRQLLDMQQDGSPMKALIAAYREYLEHAGSDKNEPVLELTRAWVMLRFFDSGLLHFSHCGSCGYPFIIPDDKAEKPFCGVCLLSLDAMPDTMS